MKINIILPSLGKSGGVLVILKYARIFSELGNDVVIYVPIVEYDLHRSNVIKNKLRQIYRTLCNLVLCFQIDTIEYIKDINVKYVLNISSKTVRDADVLIATAWPTAYDVNKLKQSKGKKYYFIQGFEIWDNREYGINSYKLELNQIVIAKWIADAIYEATGKSNQFIVNNGIDNSEFYPDKHEKKDSKYIDCLLMYHGLKEKGYAEGVEAFWRAKKQIGNLRLIVFGMEALTNMEKKEIIYHQNPSKEELRKLYSSSEIYIFPSLKEGWGLTVMEAMACGCAVVGSNVGCMLDIGINNENALLSTPGNIEELVQNIVLLAKDKNMRERIANKGRQMVRGRDWACSANLFLQILKGEYSE